MSEAESLADDARVLGVDVAAAQAVAAHAPGEIEVLPDNARAVEVFMLGATQWRTGPAGVTGLDYAAIAICARALGVPLDADTLASIGVIEREVMRRMAAHD